MGAIRVKVLYFGPAQEAAGSGEEFVQLSNPAFLEDLLKEIVKNHRGLGKMRNAMKVSVNKEIIQGNVGLSQGDEVALLPPVAGG